MLSYISTTVQSGQPAPATHTMMPVIEFKSWAFALGPSLPVVPDAGDIVFLTSDGIADNFDPFILKLARPSFVGMYETADGAEAEDEDSLDAHLPALTPHQSHEMQQELMSQAVLRLRDGAKQGSGGSFTAKVLSDGLLAHVMEVRCIGFLRFLAKKGS